MARNTLFATAFALVALAGVAAPPAQAQAPNVATTQTAPTQAAKTLPLGPVDGRTIRQVMIGDTGTTVELVFDMPPGVPQSRRVIRLENVNGMFEVTYDTASRANQPLGTGGTPRLIGKTNGMYDVVYEK